MRPTCHPGARAAAMVVASVTMIVLAACSSSSSKTASGAPRAAGNTTHAAGADQAVDVCAAVDAASARRLTGQPITTADTQAGLQAREYGCVYGNDDDSLQVEITVYRHDAASTYDTFSAGISGATQVSGLGDKAFFADGTLYVLAGTALIVVNGLDTADQSAALARPVLTAL